ncbi:MULTISPECIES: ABC transporter ATP-binding protein [Bacillus]|jgi:putative ABC transport system ATP-binding protein|uniref:ABC transporter ATP-binding protein n=2 Tax=Bacillus thuringiensis TaxID=1428 RepID=A0A9X7FUN7_BACTU|nr:MULTISPECIES: ABC transporter ATP-binding protein [Bacillus]AKR07896.1 peptide ABC transporter ATP-binding protein [Bacillus thuringiensis]KIQ86153.1 peptide ABC transporter ATP-binding protein [Bacillus sp. L_1B0_5]KIQ87838.1 peptide ABC transporter ATP-binding protein [Bacillus sp. L_1B0_8]KMP99102.1 peptide ABC transporter ATP-binding protein [Bacillus cereus]MBZ8125957.1 ABC transporter ATP-binding protein [Bacillus thuringiensis]
MIQLANVAKGYGKSNFSALKDINLTIEKGEMIAIMGPSGSGKSTLLNIIGLIESPSTGMYFLDGMDTSTFKSNYHKYRNTEVGFVFQNFSLLDDYTVVENVMLPLVYRKISHKKRIQISKEMLEMVGLERHINKYPYELSGGEQQRTAIARALAQDTKIILADEPTGALDQENGKKIMSILKEINKQGKTVLVVTHDQKVAAYCQRTIRLLDGCMV